MQKVNCANTEGMFRIIQSIPSPKAEPFKRWLAKIDYDRIQEIDDPELATKHARGIYQAAVQGGLGPKGPFPILPRVSFSCLAADSTSAWSRQRRDVVRRLSLPLSPTKEGDLKVAQGERSEPWEQMQRNRKSPPHGG